MLPEYDFWYRRVEEGDGIGEGTYGNGSGRVTDLPEEMENIWRIAPSDQTLSIKSLWFPLSEDFGSATTGLVLLFPPTTTTLGEAISCTLDARWAIGQSWPTSSTNALDRAVSLEPMHGTRLITRLAPNLDTWLFAPVDDGNWRRIIATNQ